MSISHSLEHFFKPEVRTAGDGLVAKGVVSLTPASDTVVGASVRDSSRARVEFKTSGIDSDTFTATCSCPAGGKGNFCKHMWAVLRAAETKSPDFFSEKTTMDAGGGGGAAKAESPYKAKQAEYRKEMYQKQKARAKEMKQAKKGSFKSKHEPELPDDVQEAMDYFAENGFPLEKDFNDGHIRLAKKQLSKIFHQDKGGTLDENVTLNSNFDILMDYLAR